MIPALLLSVALGEPAGAVVADDPLPPGRYGMVLDTATIQKLPFVGETKGGSRGWILLDVERTDEGLRQVMQTCDVIVTGLKGKEGRVDVPRAFIDAIPTNRPAITVTRSEDGERYRADLGPNRVGWDPALADELPTDEAHPAVTDYDGDGLPGATMVLRVPVFGRVQIYVVQDAHIRLDGAVEPGGVVRGGVTFLRMSQATLGASSALFAASPEMRPDETRSAFVMRPVPAATTCETVRATLCRLGEGC